MVELLRVKATSREVNDVLVHQTIAAATEKSHELMDECLKKILEIEGWDQTTFAMPEALNT